jgi:hypothetical protein
MQPRFVDLGRAKGGTLVHLRSGNPRYLAMKLWLTLYDFAFHLLCSPGIYPYLSIPAVNAASHQRPFIRK